MFQWLIVWSLQFVIFSPAKKGVSEILLDKEMDDSSR